MKIDDRLAILAHAADLGLGCGGGYCGSIALAMNAVLFDGKGEIVAAVNEHLWQKHGTPVGHVGVRYKRIIWDGEGTFEGEEGLEEFLSWGMLDPDDEDYAFPVGREAREAAAYGSVLLEGDAAEGIAYIMDNDDVDSKHAVLLKAIARWTQARIKSKTTPTNGSRARPNVARTPQVLTEPGDYFHPDARRFTWTPPPALPRENILATTFGTVEYASPAEAYGSPGFTAGAVTRNLSHRVAAQLVGGLQDVLPGVAPHLKAWTLQFTNTPSITAWTDPNQRQFRFGAHPLSAGMLLHEAVHVADSACYAGGGEDCFGGDAWASYDKRHPLGIFAATLRAAWKESGEDERLLDHKIRQALTPLPFPVTRALLRGEGVQVDAALEAISREAGVPSRPATLRDALERARGPFGGVDAPQFLALSGLPASASRAVIAMVSCLPTGVPIGLPARDYAAYKTTLTTRTIRSNTARYWMARHELLARYLDQYARTLLVARGRWVPPVAPGSLPESVAAELVPGARAALREVGWTR